MFEKEGVSMLTMFEKLWVVKNFPLLVTTVAVAVGLTEEQVKMQVISGASTAVVLMALWVTIRLFVWVISTVGVTQLVGIVTKNIVLAAVSALSLWLAWEYCTIDNILWVYYETRLNLMKYGVIPAGKVDDAMFD